MDPITSMIALFAPAAVEAVKAGINRWIAPDQFKPATVDQWVTMRKTEIELFQAMNNAGGSNPSYPWVEATVRLMRPAIAVLTLGTWAYLHMNGMSNPNVDATANAVGFYLFGDRTLFYAKNAVEKVAR